MVRRFLPVCFFVLDELPFLCILAFLRFGLSESSDEVSLDVDVEELLLLLLSLDELDDDDDELSLSDELDDLNQSNDKH